MRRVALGLAAATALSITAAAEAAVVTTDYTFTSSAGSGTFSIDFDNVSQSYSLSAFDFLLGSTSFDTSNTGILTLGSPPSVVGAQLGGTVSGVNVLDGTGTNDDFSFAVIFAANPTIISMVYQLAGTQGTFFSDVTISEVPSAVPEPATWAMMLIGLGAIGLATRRRRETQALA